ncbi:MAG: hypothetical protein RMM51_04545 [Verrucomicrobiae bacterium]|nr:hypothetical protein [Verrucomicrobiae bacterium]
MIGADAPSDRRLLMPWRRTIAVGRAFELTRADLVEHLRWLQREIGYQYCRFHGVFHDDMAVAVRTANGTLTFQWHQVDKVYDTLLSLGLRPFVELNPMPAALASGSQTMFHWKMNVTPPRSYDEWSALVAAFTRHIVERYGLDEVRQWFFEVWNEPNLPAFWSGTKDDYWRLFEHAARAVKSVDTRLRVGGPATSKARWILDLIEHCTRHGIPLDFISTHLYPQDEYVEYPDRRGSPHRPGEFFADTIRHVQHQVRNSDRPDLEIHWTEWNTQSAASTATVDWINNPCVDNLFAASFIVDNCLKLDDACHSMCYWVASDIFEEGGLPHSPFSATYGLLTIHGIPKAAANAFRFLRQLHGAMLPVSSEPAPPAGCGCCATQEGNISRLLLWHHQRLDEPAKPTWHSLITVRLPAHAAQQPHVVVTSRIRAGAGSAYETWCAIGRPQNLSRAEESLLRAHAEPERTGAILLPESGMLPLPVVVPPQEVVLVELRPQQISSVSKSAPDATLAELNVLLAEPSR